MGSLRAESKIQTWVQTVYKIVQRAGAGEEEERDKENEPMCGCDGPPLLKATGLRSAKTLY